jgi:anti-repressor protein
LVREFSKIIANEGIHLGEKSLYKWFREKGFIFKNSTEPMQSAVQRGLFKVSERVIKAVTGDIVRSTTKITGKGQIYFLGLLKKEFL